MAELKNLELAKATFETLCQALEKNDWRFKKNEEKMAIECGARGDDLPIDISIHVDPDRMLVMLLSRLPYSIPQDKRLDVAIAVSAINNALVDGSFDYDIASGQMYFRMTNSFVESKIGEDLIMYMLLCSCATVDEYNDKFLMLGKGVITLEQILATLKN